MKKQIFSFLCVGGIGFMLDAGLTQGFVDLANLNPYIARFPAMIIAICVTFVLNRRHTFDAHGTCAFKTFGCYLLSTVVAQGTNYSIYGALLSWSKLFHVYPFLAVVCGSMCAAMITFVLSKYWVFKR